MSDDAANIETRKRAMGAELVIPGFALVFTIYYFVTIWDSPWTAQVSAFFVGSILIVLSLVFVVLAFRLVAKGEATWGFRDLFEPFGYIKIRVLLLALTVGYLIVLPWLGFTITTFLFLSLSMALLNQGRRLKLSLTLATVLALGGYVLFIVAFQTRFPIGPFENLMKAMF